MRIVVALGGNALCRRGERPDASVQEQNVQRAVHVLAPIAAEHELVVTHANGPQVGVLALQSASDPRLTTSYPFDVLGAQTQGMIGYWLLQAMQNVLPGRQVAAIINQTLVEASDPAFEQPTTFVGEGYDEGEALEADALLVLTDVPAVMRGFGTPEEEPIRRATPAALRREEFPSGSMGPKVDAVCRFVELTGDMGAIGRLEDAVAVLRGEAGTVVTPGGDYGGPSDLGPRHW